MPGRPDAIVLTLSAAASEPAPLLVLAAAAEPWPGALALWRSDDGLGFVLDRVVDLPAVIGRTTVACPPGPLWRWDDAAVLDVVVSAPALASIDDAAALAGGNLFALQGPDDAWEILSAARAVLIGPRMYRLSRLLRGLAGSEAAAARPVPAGARIVRLDEAVVPLTSALADLGRTWTYRVAPAGRDHGDPSAIEIAATVAGDALRPLAPVHVRVRRESGGVALTWIRRTRRDGDAWEAFEVPIGEESERYEIDILGGGTVLRTLSSTVPACLYPAASEIADFGAPQAELSLRVVQMSAAVGRGAPAFVTCAVLPG